MFHSMPKKYIRDLHDCCLLKPAILSNKHNSFSQSVHSYVQSYFHIMKRDDRCQKPKGGVSYSDQSERSTECKGGVTLCYKGNV